MSAHVMIDLETLALGHDAAIISVGAVKFDPNLIGDADCEKFYCAVDPASSQGLGLKIDASTVMWWLDSQRDLSRRRLLSEERLDLPTALEGFAIWFGNESLPVWGNGATFDNVILRHAYKVIGRECPWSYKHDRCYRTFKSLAPDMRMAPALYTHHALDDAMAQTLHLKIIRSVIGVIL